MLQTQWKRVRDRYVRERRKRKMQTLSSESSSGPETSTNSEFLLRDLVKPGRGQRRRYGSVRHSQSTTDIHENTSAAARHFEEMRFLDEFLSSHESNLSSNVSVNSMRSASGEIYYSQPPNRGVSKTMGQENDNVRLSSLSKTDSRNGSPSSTSSEISVGSAAFGNSQLTEIHQSQLNLIYDQGCGNLGNSPDKNTMQLEFVNNGVRSSSLINGSNISAQLSELSSSGTYQFLSLPQQGNIQQGVPTQNCKNEIMTMIIEPQTTPSTTSYANTYNLDGNANLPKMYRLVNYSPQTEQNYRPATQQGSEVNSPTRKRPAYSQRNGKAQRTSQHVLNEQVQQISQQAHNYQQNHMQILPRTSTMIVQPPNSQNHHQQLSNRGTNRTQPNDMAQVHEPVGNYILSGTQPLPQISHQQHYDPEAALVETIVRHLGNLNDDEKVVTKMNIQRILMDARFGRGSCVRMFREEEQSENMATSLEHRHLQQHQNTRR